MEGDSGQGRDMGEMGLESLLKEGEERRNRFLKKGERWKKNTIFLEVGEKTLKIKTV